jgi:apolipoprotein D and lipocalin family protein
MLSGTAKAQAVSAVPQLDFNRFMGTWFEVARLPDKAQKKCVGNAFEIYTVADKAGSFALVESCKLKDGTSAVRNLTGKRAKKSVDGRLNVTTLWPFSRKQWVLAVGPDYDWALVGGPNHKTLWVLSRTLAMPDGTLREVEARATGEGFDVGKLVTVSQQP